MSTTYQSTTLAWRITVLIMDEVDEPIQYRDWENKNQDWGTSGQLYGCFIEGIKYYKRQEKGERVRDQTSPTERHRELKSSFWLARAQYTAQHRTGQHSSPSGCCRSFFLFWIEPSFSIIQRFCTCWIYTLHSTIICSLSNVNGGGGASAKLQKAHTIQPRLWITPALQ